jgi:hypothetical protein
VGTGRLIATSKMADWVLIIEIAGEVTWLIEEVPYEKKEKEMIKS